MKNNEKHERYKTVIFIKFFSTDKMYLDRVIAFYNLVNKVKYRILYIKYDLPL